MLPRIRVLYAHLKNNLRYSPPFNVSRCRCRFRVRCSGIENLCEIRSSNSSVCLIRLCVANRRCKVDILFYAVIGAASSDKAVTFSVPVFHGGRPFVSHASVSKHGRYGWLCSPVHFAIILRKLQRQRWRRNARDDGKSRSIDDDE